MRRYAHGWLTLSLLLGTSAGLYAQQNTAPQPIPGTPFQKKQPNCAGSAKRGKDGEWESTSNCPPPDNTKNPPPVSAKPSDSTSNSQDNSFPQEQSEKAAKAANGDKNQGPRPSTSKDNPFPEEQSEKAAKAADQSNGQAPGPSDQDSSSSRQGLNRLDLLGNRNGVQGYGNMAGMHDPKQAADDVKVGSFYMNTGDYQGAYNRFKEATMLDPGNAEAVFEVAEAARSLGKMQEAQQNYQLYLAALPRGPKAKDAKKALQEISKGK